MKKKYFIRKFSNVMAVSILTGALVLSGCGGNTTAKDNNGSTGNVVASESGQTGTDANSSGSGSVQTTLSGVTTLDITDMFSKKDQSIDYQESECVIISLSGDSAVCESSAVAIKDGTVIISQAGSYLISGSLSNGSIQVEAPEDAKVQLILDGASITTNGTAGIYVKTADKVFITLAENSVNTITNKGEFVAIDENNIDGAIFSKSDLTLNGNGSLTVSSEKGHGIVSKDDLKVTGGTYEIKAGGHGLSGKDSIRIADGTITVTSAEDGLHSGNDEDADKGYVYIAGGTITINAEDDGIHGESKVVIGGGTINVAKSYEGIEATIVEIAGGDITVNASDDGLNATDGSGTEGFGGFGGFGGRGTKNGENTDNAKDNKTTTSASADVYVLISGGKLVVNAKGDGLDSNGYLYIRGGETYVSGPEDNGNGSLDYDYTGEITGGIVIAAGSNGMAMNFNTATQGSALITLSSTHNAGELVELKDSQGNVLISYQPTTKFTSVVVSSPDMKQGETYTLTAGSEKQEFTLTDIIYGESNGFGGFGGGRMGGGKGGFGGNNGEMPEMPEMPEGFDGNFDGNFEGMPQMPGGFGGGSKGRSGESSEGGSQGSKGNKEQKKNGDNNL